MSKKKILSQEKSFPLLIVIGFFCLMFAIGFFYLIYENSNQEEMIESALDLSRAYFNRWNSCQEELFDLKNATYYEMNGCAYPLSCFSEVDDYLAQFPNGEVPQNLCTYSIYCGGMLNT